jgi:hypothetical protein
MLPLPRGNAKARPHRSQEWGVNGRQFLYHRLYRDSGLTLQPPDRQRRRHVLDFIVAANGFTGLKTTSGLSVKLKPGLYLVAVNRDVALTIRTIISPTFHLGASLGGTPMNRRFDVNQTYGAFPPPGTKRGTVVTSATGFDFPAAFQFTEYA